MVGRSNVVVAAVCLCAVAACAPHSADQRMAADTATLVEAVTGLSGPEAVRYDPDQDIYFVANFNGPSGARDNNGFITRVRPDGTVDNLQFIAGSANGVTLHAPRGMYITGDTLWAADVDAVRGFHRRTGAPIAVIDFSGHDIGFLNDIGRGPDGALYVTDSGRNRIYRISGRTVTVAVADSALNRPNGITWDAAQNHFIVVPYGGRQHLYSWRPDAPFTPLPPTIPSGRFDGVEVLSGRILVAAQSDSSLWAVHGTDVHRVVRTLGPPADIGVDTKRKRVAVPYILMNRVDIYQLPRGW